MKSLDPYDPWSSPAGIWIRERFYRGRLSGRLAAAAFALLDWMMPVLLRRSLGVQPKGYPILSAHLWRMAVLRGEWKDHRLALADLKTQAVGLPDRAAWGLGFPWMSKNGLYGPETPFVTHTPYVMETLLAIAEDESCRTEAMALFHGTWWFLESLKVMAEDGKRLALSYAPVREPRIVVNANSYGAFAYALHAVYGREEVRETARDKALRLAHWVVEQQEESGRWWYYADHSPGNFIDCFHSCFVLKNLIKVKRLLPETEAVVDEAVEKGWGFIRESLYDPRAGLCRRFAVRAHRDPYRWDLYDQAEYLGLLVDFNLLGEAREFSERVERKFRKGDYWYCRIDVFGRRWGRDFLRWGIA
ncbi:hypothetical protein D6833_03285, partial [Candidatus Parcubacteria bacterium]